MVKKGLRVFALLAAFTGLLWTASEDTQTILSVQGKLTDSSGNALTGSYDFSFTIYDAESGGNVEFTENQSGLPVTNGVYNVLVGDATVGGIPLTVFQSNTDLWLAITVESETLAPRSPLTAHAFAFCARTLQGYVPGNVAGNVPINNGTVNTNLNADLLDGQSSAYFTSASNISAGLLAPTYGGTGLNTSTTPLGSILYTSGAGAWNALGVGSAGQVLTVSGGVPSWQNPPSGGITSLNGMTGATQTFANDTNVTISSVSNIHTVNWSGQLSVSRGGTGSATLVSNALLVGNGTGALQTIAAGAAGTILTGTGGLPAFSSAPTISSVATSAQAGLTFNPYGAAGGQTGEVRFQELVANGLQYVGFKAPDNIVASGIWPLPSNLPTTGQFMGWTGSAMTWTSTLPPTATTSGQASLVVAPYGAAGGQTGEVRFRELAGNGTQYVGFKAVDSMTANQIWTLPGTDGSLGALLSTNGSGVLSWTSTLPASAETQGQDALTFPPYGAAGGQTGEVRFLELAGNGAEYVGFKAPDNIAASGMWTLPNNLPTTGQFMGWTGSAMTWTSTLPPTATTSGQASLVVAPYGAAGGQTG
ncbi:MAG: hypothetical protein RDV41_15440, partial [Planctomycetota bacterium]|nr:hypothetical protein [Planctomycetota bacterium]